MAWAAPLRGECVDRRVQLFTISTGVGTTTSPSGLSKIYGLVDNGLSDNTVQRVYGGDLLGNLWRFDVNNQYPPSGQDAVLLCKSFVVGYVPAVFSHDGACSGGLVQRQATPGLRGHRQVPGRVRRERPE